MGSQAYTGNGWPDFNGWVQNAWGSGEEGGWWGGVLNATNLVFGQNPAYYLDDFLAVYPKFFGLPTMIANCATVAGSNQIQVPSLAGLNFGQFLTSPGTFPKGTVVTGISSTLGTAQATTHGEQPQGALPGNTFTLSTVPPNGVLQLLTLNGVYQTPGIDYTLTGSTISTTAEVPPDGELWATWLVQNQTYPVHGESPLGALPGSIFTLSSVPPDGSLQTLTVNGVFLTAGTDYVLTGRTIVLASPLTSGTLYATWLVATVGYVVTLSSAALVTSNGAVLNVYQQPPVPISVIQMYLNLAWSSLVQLRWQEQWPVAMAWMIAHYCTLFAKSDASEVMETLQSAMHGEAPVGAFPGTVYTLSQAPPGGVLQSLTQNGLFLTPGGVDYTLNSTTVTLTVPTGGNDTLWATWPIQMQAFTSGQPNGAQIAAQGLAGGIQASKSVGDVSVSYQVLTSLEEWGSWQLTSYGQQLATAAKVMGAGPMVVY